jgi:hypothetical protein
MRKLNQAGARMFARALLNQARIDWNRDERHHEVEAFIDGKLIELYLEIAEVDNDAYLASVRGNGGKDNQG